MTRPPCVRLCPAYPGNPRSRIEGESPPDGKGHTACGDGTTTSFCCCLHGGSPGTSRVDRPLHYLRMASECARLARDARDLTFRALFLQMARSWTNLADHAREAELAEVSSE